MGAVQRAQPRDDDLGHAERGEDRSGSRGEAGALGGAMIATPGLPPGPRGYPLLGVLPSLRANPIRTFLAAAERFGDIVHLKAGAYHGFLVTDPAHIRHVL